MKWWPLTVSAIACKRHLKSIHVHLLYEEIFSQSCACATSLVFEKKIFLKLTIFLFLGHNHILIKVITLCESL